MNYVKESRYLAYILRHHPEEFNLILNEEGYASVEKLIENTRFNSLEELKDLVEHETRYAFNEDYSKIKAFHGHSVKGVSYEKRVVTPPDILYHGTSTKNLKLILESGEVKGMTRVNVHLSISKEDAKKIGNRHGIPVILEVDAKSMVQDGYLFSKSEDGVYLVKDFPVKYIKVLEED